MIEVGFPQNSLQFYQEGVFKSNWMASMLNLIPDLSLYIEHGCHSIRLEDSFQVKL